MATAQLVIFGSPMTVLAPSPAKRAPVFGDSPTGRRNRRLVAAGAAIALHMALLCAFLGSSAGGVVAGGGEIGPEAVEPYIVLSLAGLHRENPTSDPAMPADQDAAVLKAMLARLQDAKAEVVIAAPTQARPTSLGDLFDAVRRERAARDTGPSGTSSRDDGGRGAEGQTPDAKSLDHTAASSRADSLVKASPGSGKLWGFLEPCWRKLPGRSAVPVTLEITLNASGLISTPPKIVRPSNAPPTEDRLIAEARALAALGGCLPYRGKDASNGTPISVNFAASR